MSTALILPPTASSFRPIAGVPLIQRTVLSALRSGFERVVVMAGDEASRLRSVLDADRRTRVAEIATDLPAQLIRDGQVAVLPGDCLITAATLARVCATSLNGQQMVFAGASDAESLLLCRAQTLEQLQRVMEPPAGTWTSQLRQLGAVDTPLNGEICARVTCDATARAAETQLFAQLRAATADTDGPLARFDRSLSQWISSRLVYTPLRPNHITVIGTGVGLLASWCLARGAYWMDVLGALLFLCATVIDGCDGEVARLKFQETPFGHQFDIVTDNIVHVTILIGLGMGQYRRHPDGHYAALIVLLVCGFACASGAAYWCFLRQPESMQPRADALTTRGKIRQLLLRGFEGLMNRDFAYLIFVLAVVNRLPWFFWGAAFGTYGFAAALLWVYRWRDAA